MLNLDKSISQEKNNKIKLLKIIEILRNDSDENNYLSSTQILLRLHNLGIKCNRKTLYNDIETLNSAGYEVLCEKHSGKPNNYYITERPFSVPELRIMIDAVQAASFVTDKKTYELTNKIAELGGRFQAELFKHGAIEYNTTKHSNEQIYYAVQEIEDAIKTNRQISFYYYDYNEKIEKVFRKDKSRYIVNPYLMTITSDNYYLVVYSEKYGTMIHYRIDRMINVNIEKTYRILPEWIDNFDIMKHKKQVFGMFVGDEKKVVIEFNKSIIDAVVDKFGESIRLYVKGDKIILETEIQVSPQFISWVCSFGKLMKVISPDDIIKKIKSHIEEIAGNYL